MVQALAALTQPAATEMCVLEMVSLDRHCVRTMHVRHVTDDDAEPVIWKRSGYNVKCLLPMDARSIEVIFSVVGGFDVRRVDRDNSKRPWVKDDRGQCEYERFFYQHCPHHVQYHLCGPSLHCYVHDVNEHVSKDVVNQLPAIGGLKLASPVPDNILPPEVLLHAPMAEEVKIGNTRMIFLNTPLQDEEQRQVKELVEELERQGRSVPPCMRIHILRLMQHAKGDVQKAIKQMDKNIHAKLKWFPLDEDLLLNDLRKGALYWHGRDLKCRPCLVITMSRIDADFMANPDRICKVAVFLLEFMLRYGMCPGRVENWGVIVDLDKAGENGLPSPRLLADLVETLQGMYRFRMVWTKIINAPWWFVGVWGGVKRVVPSDSLKKVEILGKNYATSLQSLFAPNQLERRFGGDATDRVDPMDFFPLRFNPGPFSPTICERLVEPAAVCEGPEDTATHALHEYTSPETHEGALWWNGNRESWLPSVHRCSLTASAAAYLLAAHSVEVPSCDDIPSMWRQLGLIGNSAQSTNSSCHALTRSGTLETESLSALRCSTRHSTATSLDTPSVPGQSKYAALAWDAPLKDKNLQVKNGDERKHTLPALSLAALHADHGLEIVQPNVEEEVELYPQSLSWCPMMSCMPARTI